jgi:cell division protein FtsZ
LCIIKIGKDIMNTYQNFNEEGDLMNQLIQSQVIDDKQATVSTIIQPVLKVIGLGGGGCNAVERMITLGMTGIQFIAANTDHQALNDNPADIKIQLGPETTRGLGAGGDPEVGLAAAEESRSEIESALSGADMVFITAGMGGGTGTGSIPVAAEIARSIGAVTIAIVTTPFTFEIGRRQDNSNEGLLKLRQHTHTLITIPNDRLLYVAPRDLPIEVAFQLADDVLRQSVQGISELITEPGMINVDFAQAIGHGHGEEKAYQAIEQALHHPLLESVSLENAAGIIVNFTGGEDLTLFEVQDALTRLQAQTGQQTEIVMGVINDTEMKNRVQVILVITGLGAPSLEETFSKYAVSEPVSEPEEAAPQQEPSPTWQRTPFSSTSTNLDIPAFLRRRSGNVGFVDG